eukprot:8771721-Ditylum_brightwellii.AAC.1
MEWTITPLTEIVLSIQIDCWTITPHMKVALSIQTDCHSPPKNSAFDTMDYTITPHMKVALSIKMDWTFNTSGVDNHSPHRNGTFDPNGLLDYHSPH